MRLIELVTWLDLVLVALLLGITALAFIAHRRYLRLLRQYQQVVLRHEKAEQQLQELWTSAAH